VQLERWYPGIAEQAAALGAPQPSGSEPKIFINGELRTASYAPAEGPALITTRPFLEALVRQPWPGNVRELENVIERAVVLADAPASSGDTRVIDVDYLGTVMNVHPPGPPAGSVDALSIKKATRELEADLIRRALGVTQGNRTNAAKLLEISHRALLYKMKEYGIS